MSGKWNNQLEFSSKDKNFKIHVGGRTQIDTVFYQDSPAGFAGTGGVGDQDAVDFQPRSVACGRHDVQVL